MVKKPIMRRLTALFCLFCVLVSSCAVGIVRQEPKEVKAVAGVDDAVYYVAQYLLLTVISACSAGGADNSDILTPAESAGITNQASAEDYVHSTFSGNANFLKLFKIDDMKKMLAIEAQVASAYLTAGYVCNKYYMDKVWKTFNGVTHKEWLREEEYRHLIGLDDSAYNPNIDDWDPEKWEGLTEEQKIGFLAEKSEQLQYMPGLNKYVLVSPEEPDYDFDNDNDGNNDSGGNNDNNLPPVINTKSIGNMVTTGTFVMIYRLVKEMNHSDVEGKFLKDPKAPFDPSVCDYSKQYWSGHPEFLQIMDSSYYAATNSNVIARINTGFVPQSVNYIYPLVYYKDKEPWFCLAPDNDVDTSNSNLIYDYKFYPLSFGYKKDTGNGFGYHYEFSPWEKGSRLNNELGYGVPYMIDVGKEATAYKLNFDIINRGVMDSKTAIVQAPDLIDCGTYENVEKFRDLIKTGDYTADDLLKLMADGWKGVKKASWTGIDDGGKTITKKLEADDGKYTTTVKVKDKDGNEKDAKVVTYDSIVKGMTENVKTSPSVSTGVDAIFGDITYPDSGVPFPSFQDSEDNKGDSGVTTDPDDKKPTGGDGGNSDASGNDAPEDIDPEETKTPQLLKKFPFCVPWDLIALVQVLSAKATPPKFTIPFKMDTKFMKVDEKIEIDFSQYEQLAFICRWFLRLIFILSLVLLTRSIIKG